MITSGSDTAPSFSRRDRRALFAVATQFFVNGAVVASFVPRLPEVRDRIGVDLDELGLLMTAGILIGTIGSLQAPRVIERLATRRTLLVGGVLLVMALPIIGFAPTPAVFVGGIALLFAADGLVDVCMNLQGSWLSARRRAPVMNRLHGLWSMGTVIGGIIASSAAAAGIGMLPHLTVVAALLLAALLFVGNGLLRADEGGDEVAPDVDGTPAPVTPPPNARSVLTVLALAGAAAITVEMVSSDWAAFRLSEDFGAGPGLAGLGYVAFTVGMACGRFGGDFVQARLGDAGLMRVAMPTAAAGLAGASFLPSPPAVLAAYVLAGLGISTFFPRLYDQAAQFRGRRGRGLAWMRTGSSITMLLMPSIIGGLAATSLTVGTATAIVALPAAGLFFVLSMRTGRSASDHSGSP